jgi:hypothetical protein
VRYTVVDGNTVVAVVAGSSIGHGTQSPIDVRVDPFEPRHSQDHLVAAEGSDEEGFLMLNSSNCELERGDTICVNETFPISNRNQHGGAGFSDDTQSAN